MDRPTSSPETSICTAALSRVGLLVRFCINSFYFHPLPFALIHFLLCVSAFRISCVIHRRTRYCEASTALSLSFSLSLSLIFRSFEMLSLSALPLLLLVRAVSPRFIVFSRRLSSRRDFRKMNDRKEQRGKKNFCLFPIEKKRERSR